MLLLLFCCSFGPASRFGRCNYVNNYIPCIPTISLPWVGWQEQPTHYSHPSYPESTPILHASLLPHPTPSYTGLYCHPTPAHHSLPWSLVFCRPTLSYLLLPQPTLSSTAILPQPTSSYTGFFCHPTSSYPVVHSLSHLITFYPTLSYTGLSCDPTLSYLILPSPKPTNYPILPAYVLIVILPYNLIILPDYCCPPTPSYPVRYWLTDYLSFLKCKNEPLYTYRDRTYRLQIPNKSK